jgi:hypothetical protein
MFLSLFTGQFIPPLKSWAFLPNSGKNKERFCDLLGKRDFKRFRTNRGDSRYYARYNKKDRRKVFFAKIYLKDFL